MRAGDICVDIIRWMVSVEPDPTSQQGEIVQFKRRNPAQSAQPSKGNTANLYDHIRMLDAPSYPLAFIGHSEYRLESSNADHRGGY